MNYHTYQGYHGYQPLNTDECYLNGTAYLGNIVNLPCVNKEQSSYYS